MSGQKKTLAKASEDLLRRHLGPILVAVVGFSVPCLGKTIIVDLNGTGDYTAIQPALDAAEDGGEVLVKPGTYVVSEAIDFNRLAGRG